MAFLAQDICATKNWTFSETLQSHYVITKSSDTPLADWPSVELGTWRLSHCPSLPLTHLHFADGALAGLVLGFAVNGDGTLLSEAHHMPVSADDSDPFTRIERFVEDLAGRFIVLLDWKGVTRLYPDPVCGLGPVYNPSLARVGASTTLVLDRELSAPDNAETAPTPLIFSETTDRDVRRAVPNHYIDLTDFSLVRHWPRDDTVLARKEQDTDEIAAAINARLGNTIQALVRNHRSILPITGGTDSRLLLAAASDHLDAVHQFIVYHTNWANSFDAEIAQQIAQILCLPLRVISRDSPRVQTALRPYDMRQLVKRRALRGGFEVETAEKGSLRAMTLVSPGAIVLRGNVAEMTRALRWHPRVFDNPHETDFAMAKLNVYKGKAPQFDRGTVRGLAWKAALPVGAIPRRSACLRGEL
ncbi:MAG: hypothetical protein AAGP08_14930, partial [Pseudomonadota bacterium]